MSETQVKIDIDVIFTRKSTTNTVEISVTRETEILLLYKDEKVVTIGGTITPPFPIPHILLDNIVNFDPNNIYSLLYDSTLQEYPILCSRLTTKIAYEAAAEKVPTGPLHISLRVTLTPQRFIGGACPVSIEEDDDMAETCAICLQEDQDLSELPNCSHVFHDHCIIEWLCRSNTCPLCRNLVEDDVDHDYDFPELEL